jgi:hypothetical protein
MGDSGQQEPGNTEPGGPVPPYEGRKTEGQVDGEGKTGPKSVEDDGSGKQAGSGVRSASPEDEQPGVGPAHVKGTSRGENVAEGEADNPGDETSEGDDPSERSGGSS